MRFGEGTALPVEAGEPARATFALEVNEWNGVVEPRLRLRHALACEPAEGRDPAPRAGVPGERVRASVAPRGGRSEEAGQAGEQLVLL